jgi:hypothetical protein
MWGHIYAVHIAAFQHNQTLTIGAVHIIVLMYGATDLHPFLNHL